LTLWQKRTSRKCSKNGGDGEISVYMREGTTSRVMADVRPYGEYYDFYIVSSEYFGYTLVWRTWDIISSIFLTSVLSQEERSRRSICTLGE
jgi:hypothetical protein